MALVLLCTAKTMAEVFLVRRSLAIEYLLGGSD